MIMERYLHLRLDIRLDPSEIHFSTWLVHLDAMREYANLILLLDLFPVGTFYFSLLRHLIVRVDDLGFGDAAEFEFEETFIHLKLEGRLDLVQTKIEALHRLFAGF